MPEPKKPRTICVVNFYEIDRGGKYCYNTFFVKSDVSKIESKLEKIGYRKQEKQHGDEIMWEIPSKRWLQIGTKVSILHSVQEFGKTIGALLK